MSIQSEYRNAVDDLRRAYDHLNIAMDQEAHRDEPRIDDVIRKDRQAIGDAMDQVLSTCEAIELGQL